MHRFKQWLFLVRLIGLIKNSNAAQRGLLDNPETYPKNNTFPVTNLPTGCGEGSQLF
jgi:hypothetical protein